MEGNMRFNELQRKLPGISARVLSNELKELELNGLVCKMTINGHPPTFEYGRTEYAGSLHEVMRALVTWGVQHRNKIRNREI